MKINMEDVCENIQILYDIVGMENFLEISKMYGGTNIYIPTYKSVIRNNRNREIIRKYNGKNINILANEYGISSTQIKKIINIDKAL